MPGGRPTKYTPEIAEAILASMATGIGKEVAARCEGVTAETVNNWAKRRPSFSTLLAAADARFERNHASRIGAASAGPVPGDWRASAWILERKYHDRWGKREKVDNTHAGPAGASIPVSTTITFRRVGAPASAETEDADDKDTTPNGNEETSDDD